MYQLVDKCAVSLCISVLNLHTVFLPGGGVGRAECRHVVRQPMVDPFFMPAFGWLPSGGLAQPAAGFTAQGLGY